MKHQRIQWIDVAKAFGIIAVVLGHNLPYHGAFYHFIYWWHMPLFFMVGGFFLKPLSNDLHKFIPTWWAFFKKRIWPLLIGYFVLGVFFILAYHVIHHPTWHYTVGYFIRLLWGGRTLNLYLTNYWFIEVYIITITVLTFVLTYIKSVRVQYFLAFFSLIIGMSYDRITVWKHFSYWATPWDFDVALLAFFFMFMGRELFQHGRQWFSKWYVILGSMALGVILFYVQHSGIGYFAMYMKSHKIYAAPSNTTTWMSVVPIILVIGVFGVSYYVEKWTPIASSFLAIIGENSLVIMYWHKFIFDIMNEANLTNWQLQVIVGVLLPVAVVVIYQWIKQRIVRGHNKRNIESSAS